MAAIVTFLAAVFSGLRGAQPSAPLGRTHAQENEVGLAGAGSVVEEDTLP